MNFDKLIATFLPFIESRIEFIAAIAAFIAFSLLLILFFRSNTKPPQNTQGVKPRQPVGRPAPSFASLKQESDVRSDFSPQDNQAAPSAPSALITPATIAEQFAAIDALEQNRQHDGQSPSDPSLLESLKPDGSEKQKAELQELNARSAESRTAQIDDPERRALLADIEAELLSLRRLYQARMIAPEIYLMKTRQIATKLAAVSA